MKRLLLGFAAVALVLGAYALSREGGEGDKNPWTDAPINDDPNTFQFAIVSDRTGGHRARVFSEAIDKLNLMQPSFVLSVGDLIEGYSKEQPVLTAEWNEFQSYVKKLDMRFYYLPGNHDVANPLQSKLWKEKFGKSYYHFVWRNVLFLLINSDDPSVEKGGSKLSPEQIAYAQKALRDNPKVNWTMVFMHKPLWRSAKLEETGWLEVEKALQDRQYTVFVGHEHVYQKFIRHGKSYYQLATTGGGSKMRGVPYGEFDHIVWVTMKKQGPVLANILLDGILPENLTPTISDEKGVPETNRKKVFAAGGKVIFKGEAVPNALIAFYDVPGDPKKPRLIADGVADALGNCTLSTYTPFDGAPAGSYTVTVSLNVPRFDEATGKPGPNKLPERYSKLATSDLRVEVKAGQANTFTLNLMP
jgi:serine/threonine-protein phosphatase CPPED1